MRLVERREVVTPELSESDVAMAVVAAAVAVIEVAVVVLCVMIGMRAEVPAVMGTVGTVIGVTEAIAVV